MSDLESDLVERKETAADGRKIRRNVSAFANDLPGHGKPGVVLVGVRDDGSCASLAIDDELLKRLANIHGEGDIQPLPSLTVQRRVLRGCAVAVVTVEPSCGSPGTVPRSRLGAGRAYRSRSLRGGRTTAGRAPPRLESAVRHAARRWRSRRRPRSGLRTRPVPAECHRLRSAGTK